MSIKLAKILPLENLNDYKVHLACRNEDNLNPLDVFVRSKDEWKSWNTWRGSKDDFNRKFIYSLIDFYPERNIWLFGGIYKILSRSKKNYAHSYKLEIAEDSQEFIGRLKIRFNRPGRAKAVKLENYYKKFILSEILKAPYTGEVFCGYENINHEFQSIENIIKTAKPDWKSALINIKGVYLITDKSNGKKYVGSAYGDSGIWARWESYIGTGHGGNEDLKDLIKEKGIEHAKNNFTFSLLEYRSMKADNNVIIDREQYWKRVLLTIGPHGYNKK